MGNRTGREATFSETGDGLYIAVASNNQITDKMSEIFPHIDTKKYMINAVLTKEPKVKTIKNYYHDRHGNFVIYEIKKSTKNCQIFNECIRILENEQRIKKHDNSFEEQDKVTTTTTTPDYHLYMVVIKVNTD